MRYKLYKYFVCTFYILHYDIIILIVVCYDSDSNVKWYYEILQQAAP